jgi:hypothetical protein
MFRHQHRVESATEISYPGASLQSARSGAVRALERIQCRNSNREPPAGRPDAITVLPPADATTATLTSIFDFGQEMQNMSGGLFNEHSGDCCWRGYSFF